MALVRLNLEYDVGSELTGPIHAFVIAKDLRSTRSKSVAVVVYPPPAIASFSGACNILSCDGGLFIRSKCSIIFG